MNDDEVRGEEDIAIASFMDGEPDTDFFGRVFPPPYPVLPQYTPKAVGPIGRDHGRLIQRRETHRYGTIRLEMFWEDGYSEWKLFIDPKRYKAGTIVNGVYYDPDWILPEDEERAQDDGGMHKKQSSQALATTISDPEDQGQCKHSSKKRRKSQDLSDKSTDPSELHPALVGDFVIEEQEYEWPKLPEFPVEPIGPQLDLFGGDDDGSNDQDGIDDWLRGEDADPIAQFLRGLDGD
jgi:hypothetical protein